MNHPFRKVFCIVAILCLCTMSFGVTANAAPRTKVTITMTKEEMRKKLKDAKDNLHTKIHNGIGNLVNLDLGDVGQVIVSTWDDIDVNLRNVPVNINININIGNITIGK